MTWRDRMGPASFRGVHFFVDAAERAGGRRTVAHEYPLRDEPFVEDLGRAARRFTVEAHVLGGDYLTRKDQLIAALETQGPGELVHPYYGTLRVICPTFRVRESTTDGGIARFAIDFEETEAQPVSPVVAVDAANVLVATAGGAMDACEAEFLAVYDILDLPLFALESLSAIVAAASAAMDLALLPFVVGTQAIADIKRQLDGIVLDADALVREPFKVVGAFRAAVESLGTGVLLPRRGVEALLDAYGFTTPVTPPATTPVRLQELANFAALQRMIQRLLAVEAARAAVGDTYDSYEDAVSVRDAIAELLDEQIETASDDTIPALSQLRADLVRAVPDPSAGLPHLVSYTPPATVPSLALAHQLYGDVTHEADLIARNRIRHPGFVMGGVELEVLSRG